MGRCPCFFFWTFGAASCPLIGVRSRQEVATVTAARPASLFFELSPGSVQKLKAHRFGGLLGSQMVLRLQQSFPGLPFEFPT
eukprot:2153671-Alexandrium_andersonii.AAC.1